MSAADLGNVPSPWTVDGSGYLLTPSGAKVARIDNGCIMLLDKRTHLEVPFTFADWQTVTQTEPERES
jgi:hypothetical protein